LHGKHLNNGGGAARAAAYPMTAAASTEGSTMTVLSGEVELVDAGPRAAAAPLTADELAVTRPSSVLRAAVLVAFAAMVVGGAAMFAMFLARGRGHQTVADATPASGSSAAAAVPNTSAVAATPAIAPVPSAADAPTPSLDAPKAGAATLPAPAAATTAAATTTTAAATTPAAATTTAPQTTTAPAARGTHATAAGAPARPRDSRKAPAPATRTKPVR
jgi:hypothetical protein